jgi:hypothetical protein
MLIFAIQPFTGPRALQVSLSQTTGKALSLCDDITGKLLREFRTARFQAATDAAFATTRLSQRACHNPLPPSHARRKSSALSPRPQTTYIALSNCFPNNACRTRLA